jgi:serine/threonine-protein kinase
LGPYEILGTLGAGGMGHVYRARDPRLTRDVAIKVMAAELANDAAWLRRFEEEARATAALSHPNVLAVYDVGRSDGVSYIVTELLDGETLRERLAHGPLPIRKAVEVALQTLSGLGAAHARGIVHRDLKPENIFLTRDGHAKILDFGLAKVTKLSGSAAPDSLPTLVSESELVVGTVSYMAPEQARGLAADARSDLFSFGAILYEMLCGQRAFHRNSMADTLCAILKEEPPSLPRRSVGYPPALVRVLNRCLEKDATDRFQSARDVAFALESICDQHPEVAEVHDKPAERSIAVLPFTNMGADAEQEYFSDGLADELINALAGLGGLRVVSRTSAFRFRGRDLDIREIGRQLHVETVLEGSVRRSGKRLRITAQLINVADGYHLWSQRYDRELEDVFAIQDEITESIVKTLTPTLLGERQPAACRHTENLEAFELYLKGRHFWQQRTQSSLRAGIECFEKAIALDPNYALAHAGVADSFSILRPYGYVTKEEAKGKAETASRRAMELDPTLAEAHFALALYKLFLTEDWTTAEKYFHQAVEIAPRTALFQVYFGLFLAARNRVEEAETCTAKAIELDPLSPFVYAVAAIAMSTVRHKDDAIHLAERAIELQSDHALGLWSLGFICCEQGNYERAIEALERGALISKRTAFFMGPLGMAHALAGRRTAALTLRDELLRRSREEYIVPSSFLQIDVGLGDRDEIYKDLQACLDDKISGFQLEILVGSLLDPLDAEPRFSEMFRRFHLVQPRGIFGDKSLIHSR